MRDIVLSARRQKIEILYFLVCLLLSFLLNVYSIIAFHTEWKELWTQSLWVFIIGCAFYGFSVVFRLVICLFLRKRNRR